MTSNTAGGSGKKIKQAENITGKILDALDVVSDCHDILPSFAGWDDAVGPSSKTDAFECVQDPIAKFFRCHHVFLKNGRPRGSRGPTVL